ncbi:MAG: preprotein translocase subunit SecA [Planctomycetia bacterium]|nr:preprotein translocase subunit SecA [Planctomycetia bacterium]
MNPMLSSTSMPSTWWNRTFQRRRRPAFDVAETLHSFSCAVERHLGITPFDSQLHAATLLAQGRAVEMRTGEGKTLAVAAAAAARAIAGRSVHVATVNRYLADRDFHTFAPVLRSMGLSVGLVDGRATSEIKRQAYGSQIVYATGYDLGFDYLRDQQRRARQNSSRLGDELVRRLSGIDNTHDMPMPLDFVIIDEADSVLLDEASVPLLLAESTNQNVKDAAATESAAQSCRELNLGRDYLVDSHSRVISLTMNGADTIEHRLRPRPELLLLRPWRQYVEHALIAHLLLQRDVDYIVFDNRIHLVDTTTGRIFDDRRWSEGLQQAVEWKERLPFSQPTIGSASITRACFFRSYRTMAGISGTLIEAAGELRSTFGLTVEAIPPRLPSRLIELPTRYFATPEARRRAVALETEAMQRLGRPVLVGCRTIAESAAIAEEFKRRRISHRVLDGRQTEAEAAIIAEAGRSGIVTIATNMAGRGTDIRLGKSAKDCGGLHVIGIERNDSARIDRQLLGRAGRQGDPGSGRYFVAASDSLIANDPKLIASMVQSAEANGEAHGNFEQQWTECRRVVELDALKRRASIEQRYLRRADSTTILLG